MQAGLALLALRRTLPRGLLALVLAVLAVAAMRDWGASELVRDAVGDDASARAFARQGVWLLVGVLLLPALVLRAGGTIPRWRRADADWLASRAVGRGAVVLSTFAGIWAGGAVLILAGAACAEIAAGAAPPAWQLVRTLDHPALVLLDEDEARCTLAGLGAEVAPGARLLLRPTVAPGAGPSADVEFRVLAGGASTAVSARLAGRTSIELPLEVDGASEVTLRLRRLAPGAVVVLPRASTSLLAPVASERRATFGMAARLLLLAGAWIALALGLGAWVQGPIAAALVLSAWLFPWFWDAAPDWFPGGDLFLAAIVVGDGLVPAPVSATNLAGFLLCVAGGLLLAMRGLASWRSAP